MIGGFKMLRLFFLVRFLIVHNLVIKGWPLINCLMNSAQDISEQILTLKKSDNSSSSTAITRLDLATYIYSLSENPFYYVRNIKTSTS